MCLRNFQICAVFNFLSNTFLAENVEQTISQMRSRQKEERKKVTLLRQPLQTLGYFVLVLKAQAEWLAQFIFVKYRQWSLIALAAVSIYALGLNFNSPLQPVRCNPNLKILADDSLSYSFFGPTLSRRSNLLLNY